MKRSRMTNWVLASALAILLVCTTLVQADLIENGNFENGGTGWTVPADSSEHVFFELGDEGNHVVRLEENHIDYDDAWSTVRFTHETAVTLSEGEAICFEFVFIGESVECDLFQVWLDAEKVFEYSSRYGPLDEFTWAQTDPVDATGSYGLEFRLMGRDDLSWSTVILDNAGVCSVVPVPGAVLLGCIGLGYAGLHLRRRTRDAA
ncbi:MAG: hypothetical protein KBE65_12320 [Phycisphaerae bacterium]|nr:hypothetical protein [Phycisphaerae bacterium]